MNHNSTVNGLYMIIAATILGGLFVWGCYLLSSVVPKTSDQACSLNGNINGTYKLNVNGTHKMEIVTDKGANWNGIYVLNTETGTIKFYATSESF